MASNGCVKFSLVVSILMLTGTSYYVAVTGRFGIGVVTDIGQAPHEIGMGGPPVDGDEKPWRVVEQKPWSVIEKGEVEEAKEPEKKEEEPAKEKVTKKEEAKEPEKKEEEPAKEKVKKKEEAKDVEKKEEEPAKEKVTKKEEAKEPEKKEEEPAKEKVKKKEEAKDVEKKEEEPAKEEVKKKEEAKDVEKKEEEPAKEKVTKKEEAKDVEKKEEEPAKEEVKKKEEAKDVEKKEEEPAKEEAKERLRKQDLPKEEEKETTTATSDGKEAERGLSSKKTPLNILLLYGDDWRHDSLGSASNGLVKTPFLDKLATEGIRFTHNCVTTSVCWISRATLYSGQYVSTHNSTQPTSPYFYNGWNQTFPFLLREKGYYFGHVGKWHFRTDFLEDKMDFQRSYYGAHWYDTKDGPLHTTKRNEQDAIDFLRERPKDKPFCLTVCFFTPHSVDGNPEQYLPQNESMALYADDTIPLAPSATEEAYKKLPSFFGDINEGRYRYRLRFDTPEKHQKMMKNYFRLISEIDSTSERIFQELEAQGVLDDTLIIFTTDNGYFHAEHGLAGKWYPHQESIRVPLIVRDPRMPKDKIGQLMDDFTLSVDLAPTILGAAGIETPDVMQGRDFSVLYTEEGDTTPWRTEFFYEHPVHLKKDIIPASEALVRKDYKYMLWPNYDVEQFFDLKNDTYELNDLIQSEEHKELIGEMRTRFEELKKVAGPHKLYEGE